MEKMEEFVKEEEQLGTSDRLVNAVIDTFAHMKLKDEADKAGMPLPEYIRLAETTAGILEGILGGKHNGKKDQPYC
jgi:hypothetical protein